MVGGRAVVRSFGRQRWQHQIGRNCTVVCRPHLLIFFLSVRRLDVSANCRLRHHAAVTVVVVVVVDKAPYRGAPYRRSASRPSFRPFVRPSVGRSVGRSQQRVIARPSTAKIIIEHGVAMDDDE